MNCTNDIVESCPGSAAGLEPHESFPWGRKEGNGVSWEATMLTEGVLPQPPQPPPLPFTEKNQIKFEVCWYCGSGLATPAVAIEISQHVNVVKVLTWLLWEELRPAVPMCAQVCIHLRVCLEGKFFYTLLNCCRTVDLCLSHLHTLEHGKGGGTLHIRTVLMPSHSTTPPPRRY